MISRTIRATKRFEIRHDFVNVYLERSMAILNSRRQKAVGGTTRIEILRLH